MRATRRVSSSLSTRHRKLVLRFGDEIAGIMALVQLV
jgi:hypothetical protein